jgi:NTP pyrophosphatase (non-canonical NTP hydrolase)
VSSTTTPVLTSLINNVHRLETALDGAAARLDAPELTKHAEGLRDWRKAQIRMDIEEYQCRAHQLSFYAESHFEGGDPAEMKKELDMAVLGMGGEFLKEIEPLLNTSRWKRTDALEEEFGDFLWYLALYASWHRIDLKKYSANSTPSTMARSVPGKVSASGTNNNRTVYVATLRKALGNTLERTKKVLHGSAKPWDPGDVERDVAILFTTTLGILRRLRIEPSVVYAKNITKLEKRSGKKTLYHGNYL